jgi:hypothetical protein
MASDPSNAFDPRTANEAFRTWDLGAVLAVAPHPVEIINDHTALGLASDVAAIALYRKFTSTHEAGPVQWQSTIASRAVDHRGG